jgi:hypothetical protein
MATPPRPLPCRLPCWQKLLAPALLAAMVGAVAAPQADAGAGRASAPGDPATAAAAALAAHRQQRAHCLSLRVAAVQAECLRQADRDLARRLADTRARAAAAPASAARRP